MSDAIETAILWTDHVYPTSLRNPDRHALPMKTVTEQRSWHDSLENRVRWQLRDMLPHDFRIVEGVEVRKVSHKSSGLVYKVNGEGASLGIETAVARVIALAGESEVAG